MLAELGTAARRFQHAAPTQLKCQRFEPRKFPLVAWGAYLLDRLHALTARDSKVLLSEKLQWLAAAIHRICLRIHVCRNVHVC